MNNVVRWKADMLDIMLFFAPVRLEFIMRVFEQLLFRPIKRMPGFQFAEKDYRFYIKENGWGYWIDKEEEQHIVKKVLPVNDKICRT